MKLSVEGNSARLAVNSDSLDIYNNIYKICRTWYDTLYKTGIVKKLLFCDMNTFDFVYCAIFSGFFIFCVDFSSVHAMSFKSELWELLEHSDGLYDSQPEH